MSSQDSSQNSGGIDRSVPLVCAYTVLKAELGVDSVFFLLISSEDLFCWVTCLIAWPGAMTSECFLPTETVNSSPGYFNPGKTATA